MATIRGTGGDDTLAGGAGANSILGGGGNDLLLADGGDTLLGGAGNDRLDASMGTWDGLNVKAPTLIGGDGDDTYVWNGDDGPHLRLRQSQHGWADLGGATRAA